MAEAIAAGWRGVRPDDTLDLIPIADGGEGTVDAILAAVGGERVALNVTGPLGVPVEAVYGVLKDGTAVVELAAASGLGLVPESRRNPALTTSRGTGELLRHAAEHGAGAIVLGIGGSATNDGGAGMLQGLGFRLLDEKGREIGPGGAALGGLARIEAPGGGTLPKITVACDVNNPLLGPNGASRVYGPQKGATKAQVIVLDRTLGHYADVAAACCGKDYRDTPGAGAAGGVGFAALSFLGAALRPGIGLVAEVVGLDGRIGAADLVITGEGRVDAQSRMGKAVGGVLGIARRHGKLAGVVAGSLGEGHESLGCATSLIAPAGTPVAESMERAAEFLAATAARLARGVG